MHAFSLTERDLETGDREIRVEGEVDLAVADQLLAAIARGGEENVLVDLSACEFIDSSAIAVIVRAHQKWTQGGRRFAVHSANHQVLKVLDVTGLTANGLVFDNRDAALFSRPAS